MRLPTARIALTFLAIGVLSGCSTAPTTQTHYAITPHVVVASLLPPPPVAGSAADRADVAAVLEAQEKRTPEEASFAKADADISIFRFNDVLGPNFKAENLPVLDGFFAKIKEDEHDIVEVMKKYYARPRPHLVDPRIVPIVEKPNNTSYPSGHTTFAYMTAALLAQMVPEKAAELYNRAAIYGHNRIVAGIHYPTDIEAGKIAGITIASNFMQDPAFQRDFAQAKAELRQKLGYDITNRR